MISAMEKLVDGMAQLNRRAVLENAETLFLSGMSSEDVFSLLHRGMEYVNNSCAAGEYFISDLIMANNIYRDAVDMITRIDSSAVAEFMGKVLLGTVEGDIHDLGKNLISIILHNSGFEVVDLGSSISPERFCSAVMTHAPHLLVLSGSISGSEIMMARTIEAIERAGIRSCVRIILGGNCIDEQQALLIGADGYSRDVLDCVRQCRRLVREGAE